MSIKRWEHFYHQADIGLRGFGRTIAEAFENAAVALIAVIAEPETIAAGEKVEVNCQCPDREVLLVDWLNAIIYEMATRRMLFSRFEVQIEKVELKAYIWGEPLDIDKHQPTVEVKAATYTALKVQCDRAGLWLAQCVVDV